MGHFTDKVAIVTGAASGIGAALGRELARNGATVILADINSSMLEEITEITCGGSDRGLKKGFRSQCSGFRY